MKQKQPNARIVESLENLKEELGKNSDTRSKEIWFKINSCLFAQYPVNGKPVYRTENDKVREAIKTLSEISHVEPTEIIELLTGHLWDEEEAGDLKGEIDVC